MYRKKRSGLDWKKLIKHDCPQCGNPLDKLCGNFACLKCEFYCNKKKGNQVIADIMLREDEKKREGMADGYLEGYGK